MAFLSKLAPYAFRAGLWLSVCSLAKAEQYNQALENGRQMWNRKDYDAAVLTFSEIITRDNKCADAFYGRGMSYAMQGRYDAAARDFSVAIELAPLMAAAFRNRGLSYNALGETRQAILDFSEAIRIEPGDAVSYVNRSLAHLRAAEYAAAIEDASKAASLDESCVAAYNNRSAARFAIGDYDAAIADASEAIRLSPDEPTGYASRCQGLLAKGDTELALEDATKVIAISPNSAVGYNLRAGVHKQAKRIGKAIEDLDRAVKFLPDETDLRLRLAGLYHASGDHARAIAVTSIVLGLKPDCALAFYTRGLARHATHDYDGAISDYTDVIQLNVDDGDGTLAYAYYGRATALLAKAGIDFAEARRRGLTADDKRRCPPMTELRSNSTHRPGDSEPSDDR